MKKNFFAILMGILFLSPILTVEAKVWRVNN